jgi:MazG family protein
MDSFDRLRAVTSRLRAPDGCPWDRAQTPQTLARHLQGELAEVIDAIDNGDDDALSEEIGDLLFVALLLVESAGPKISLDDALTRVADKIVRRHPHVFAGATERPDWAAQKEAEHPRESVLDGVPRSLPTLARAHELTARAATVGFDWPDITGVRAKLDEETAELDEAMASGDAGAIGHELGDLLFTLVNMGRFLPVGADEALRGTNHRFEQRFREVERRVKASGSTMRDTDAATLDRHWVDAKKHLG